jgi:tetratricopeptide (TPR) repeat protein
MSTAEEENVTPVKEEPDTDDEAPKKARWDMTTEEKLNAAKGKQERGNACFKKQDVDRAIRRYISAIDYISFDYDFSSTDARRAKERRLPCHTNLAMCYIKQEKYYDAKRECDKALEIDAKSVKALFRRGVSLSRTGDYSKAKKDFNAVLKLEPKDKKTLKEIAKIDALKERKKKKERKFSERMMKNMSGTFTEKRAIHESRQSLLNTLINNGIFSFQSFDKILDVVARNWENCYMAISILCCSGHALGIVGNESYVSSTFLAIGLLAGGSTHLKSLSSFEKLLPSWIPQKSIVSQIFAGAELFLGMALLTSVKLVDRGIIGRIITTLSVLLAVPMTVQVRMLDFKKIMEDPHVIYFLRRYALAILFGIWGLGVSGG